MLYHLIYLSSATQEFDEASLDDLLDVARRNNASLGVSGMLLYNDGNFIQYVEGEEADVRALFARIAVDPRHSGVLTVSEGPVDHRVFADWSMGFRTLTPIEREALGRFDLNRAALDRRISPDAPAVLKAMMRSFYEGTRRYASA
jgi:hypothetical protein